MLTGKVTGRVAVSRLRPGSDLLEGVNELVDKAGFAAATVQFIGAARKAVVQAYDEQKKEYVTVNLEGPLEIVSGGGNISLKDKKPFAHIHAVFADLKGHCRGGHVAPGTVLFMAEVILTEISTDEPLERRLDEEMGLAVWP